MGITVSRWHGPGEEMRAENADVTELLTRWNAGGEDVRTELFQQVYDELRRLARSHLRRERPGHTLQPTALANEAYLRLIDQDRVDWKSRAHFFGIASHMMRRILVDHARARNAQRRGEGAPHVTFDPEAIGNDDADVDLIDLDDALSKLGGIDPRAVKVVEMTCFGGFTNAETAEVLGVSVRTVKRDLNVSRAWLARALKHSGGRR